MISSLISSSIILILAASPAAGYTLQIFGNANMDGVIDELDIAALEGMIEGSLAKTYLADADGDGEIDGDDLDRVREIIRGGPAEIALIDGAGRIVTIKTPVSRIVPLHMRHATAVVVLGGEEAIVGVGSTVLEREGLFLDLMDRPSVGSHREPDLEAILELSPDLVIAFTQTGAMDQLEDKLPSEVALLRFDLSRSDDLLEEMTLLGILIGDREAAKAYEEWYDTYMGQVVERVAGIPEEERAKAFLERERTEREASTRWAYASDTGYTDLCDVAGGVNIAKGKIEYHGDVEAEWVMEANPEVIIGLSYSGGYGADDHTLLKAYRDGIMKAPGFDLVDAVRDGRVYVISGDFSLGPQMTIGAVVVAKWLYPELFADLDPEAIHREFLMEFMDVDPDLAGSGAFVYPPAS
ncbi:ABC transporter substrate-binding protein [Candidatus Methanocrinis natronophilus]|uniref:ABC transporter substrate-binding protein n=1 Tax=Candidatus Methanocrinis natronophilus TaxID=3033396 RepID=A0ABT5X6P1_9EURY|nr:ABC transporter substrate-binding protein [Candidatus Methanocrinis natronophilus]MDF0590361.1 ABC transporter substrate-binding protein [Candidatus Methanocrinis natronophilus]